jgi:hypothetical protein
MGEGRLRMTTKKSEEQIKLKIKEAYHMYNTRAYRTKEENVKMAAMIMAWLWTLVPEEYLDDIANVDLGDGLVIDAVKLREDIE